MEERNPGKADKHPIGRGALAASGLLVAGLLLLWVFPTFWFTRSEAEVESVWLTPRKELPGWDFGAETVTKAEESALVADALFSGAYTNQTNGLVIRVFSAKRYTESARDIGLFVHTPDRCWTHGGWKLEPTEPTHVEVDVRGLKIVFERRVFVSGLHRELVYFGGLVGGQPLPYRLDHNYSVALKYQVKRADSEIDTRGAGARAFDALFWKRIWDGFVARRPLLGPKQFLRVSTGIQGENIAAADRALVDFLRVWLEPVDFQKELTAWRAKQQS
jgi:hypothetical protein